MPETPFTVKLPDGSSHQCYSPSSVVLKYFSAGQILTAQDFLEKSREALNDASERVRKKFGFSCTAAMASLDEIEHFMSKLDAKDTVTITHI
jgi:uncharacterized repeat protein (TIGR04042 family)